MHQPRGASAKRLARFLSRLSIRLLAFNVLLVFLPAAGLLYLDTYEKQLLRAQEQAMVQQGRLLAAALARPDGIDTWEADRILFTLRQRHQARLRVVDAEGNLLADSSRLGGERVEQAPSPPYAESLGWLYELGALPFRLYRRVARPLDSEIGSGEFYSASKRLLGSEIQAALAGRYGAATRLSGGQRSVTLYAAIPIQYGGRVIGAALVSQSTYAILQALYAVRVDIFRVVILSVLAAGVLSLLVSTTIARPLRRLASEARAIVDRRGRLQGWFHGSRGNDEIDDLSRALEDLTGRLHQHIAFIESFASDVSHEFKNPLASIRSATELLSDVGDPAERRSLLRVVEREVARMEHLLSGVREITRIDAGMEDGAVPVNLGELLAAIAAGYGQRTGRGIRLEVAPIEPAPFVRAVPERLSQVFENLLDNAISFSPDGGTVRVELERRTDGIVARVADEGPGILPEHDERIFERFFTYRPGSPQRNSHTGLGLPIAKAIVEGYGGSIAARTQAAGGACFEVRLPETKRA